MKPTPFKTRRMPNVGDVILDTQNGEQATVVELRGSTLILVRGTTWPELTYGRHPRYFNF